MFAIKSVGSVLAPYDTDQMIPTFGFGARLPPGGQVSHCFPLNFNYQNPEVNGIQVSVHINYCVSVFLYRHRVTGIIKMKNLIMTISMSCK